MRAGFVGAMLVAVIALGSAADALAATARVRCHVEPDRLRVRVDGMDLTAGTYYAVLRNVTTGARVRTEPGKEQTVSRGIGDVDLDFDSTADATDGDSFISEGFARVGHRVRASVVDQATREVEAAASTTCIAK